jgi:arylsulfatase A-like enzyme
MKRRKFIRVAATLPLVPLVSCGGSRSALPVAEAAEPASPEIPGDKNIIFIVADDLNASVEGFGGHPQAVTPNLHRLKEMGVSFTNAHANSPLCQPSRPSFLSGLMASSTGHYHSTPSSFRDRPAFTDAVMLPEHFKEHGYNVYMTGKVFHDSKQTAFGKSGPFSDLRPFLGYGTSYGPYPWNGDYQMYPQKSKNYDFPRVINGKSFGFGRLSSPPAWPSGVPGWFYGDNGYLGGEGKNRGRFVYKNDTDRSLLPDELSANWVINLLQSLDAVSVDSDGNSNVAQPIDSAMPFVINCGFTKPHTPNYVPDRFFDDVLTKNLIDSVDDIMLPALPPGDTLDPVDGKPGDESSPEDLDDIPKWRLRNPEATGKNRYQAMIEGGEDWPGGIDRLFKEAIHAYLASILFVDEQVGKILDALAASPYANNTLVVFTSDHGYARGEKEWFFKYSVWSESTHVPLIFASPGNKFNLAKGDVCHRPVSLVDIYPTISALADLPSIPTPGSTPNIDGRSLVPLLIDPMAKPAGLLPFAVSMIKTYVMDTSKDWIDPDQATISGVSEKWRYTQSFNDGKIEEELYDLQNDPYEWVNLAKKGRYLEVKQYFDYHFSKLLVCNGKYRTQYYLSYSPNEFEVDLFV